MVDQIGSDTKGGYLYSSFHGFRTETSAKWRGKNAYVFCLLLGDGTDRGLANLRGYFLDGVQIRCEVAVIYNPMVLIVCEYDFRSGQRTNASYFVHQKEASVFFESFIKEHGLEEDIRLEGAKKAVDFRKNLGIPLKQSEGYP
jgi:hypothetical protein